MIIVELPEILVIEEEDGETVFENASTTFFISPTSNFEVIESTKNNCLLCIDGADHSINLCKKDTVNIIEIAVRNFNKHVQSKEQN